MTLNQSRMDAHGCATTRGHLGQGGQIDDESESSRSSRSLQDLSDAFESDHTNTHIHLTEDNLARRSDCAGIQKDHGLLSSMLPIPGFGNTAPWALIGTIFECEHIGELGPKLEYVHDASQYIEGWMWAFHQLPSVQEPSALAEDGDSTEWGEACVGIGAQFS